MVDLSDRFVRETTEMLRTVSNALLDLEDEPAAGNGDRVDELFRVAHSLKGRFATEGLDAASDLAHALEDVVDAVRAGRLPPTGRVIDDALSAVDACQAIVDEHHETGEDDIDVEPILAKLEAHVETAGAPTDRDAGAESSDGRSSADVDAAGADEADTGTADVMGDDAEAQGDVTGADAAALDDEPDGEFSPEVRQALDDAAEFDDLDDLLDDAEAESSLAAPVDDGDVEGWGTFDGAPGDPGTDDSAASDDAVVSDDSAAGGSAPAPSPSESESTLPSTDAEAASSPDGEPAGDGTAGMVEGDSTAVTDEGDGTAGPGAPPEEDDGSAGGDETDGFDEFITFQEMKEGVDDREEDLDELQADIEAEAFGEFDADDDVSVEELMDIEAAGEVTASPAAPADKSVTDDLQTFDAVRESVDPTAEDLDELQADIEAEAFGEFDADDDMSIEELIEADPSELDPEAGLQGADAAGDADDGDQDASAHGDATNADAPVGGAGDDASTSDDTASDDTATASPGEPVSVDPSEAEADVDDPVTVEADDPATVDADNPDAAGPEEPATGVTGDGSAPESRVDGTATPADGAVLLPEWFLSGEVDATSAREVSEPSSPGDEPAVANGAVADDPSDATGGGDATDEGGADDFELSAENPFDYGTDDEAAEEASAPLDEELLDDGFPDLAGAVDGSDEPPADASDDGSVGVDADFAFGFGQDEDYLDRLEFDSMFARYFSEDGALFGVPSGVGAEAATTIEETRLDAEQFETAADQDWRDATGPGASTGSVQSLSVDVETADVLLRLAEGLGNAQRRLEQAIEARDVETIEEVVADMRPFTADLHRSVMSMRLMPLDTVTARLPRIVRDVAREQGKEVDVSVAGEDVRLDRNIIERLEDPLVHLVRNAVDHGIEPPDERERTGKHREGNLEIRAERTRDRVVIELSDDGRGIATDELLESAIEQGLVTEREADALSREALLEYVFRPQFSTRGEVTDVSGRGVGMDVVRKTVEDLTGSVDIESTPGEGTTVRLTLPVTVAVAQVLFVHAGGRRFAIPTAEIAAVELAGEPTTFGAGTTSVTTPFDDASQADGAGIVAVDRDASAPDSEGGVETAPVSDDGASDGEAGAARDGYETAQLANAMRIDEAADGGSVPAGREKIVRFRTEVRPLELRCADVGDLEEVVVRPFEDLLGGTPGISGTTTGGGEGLVPVIDVRSLEP